MEKLPEFEKWLRSVCFQPPTASAYDLAKSAWGESARHYRTNFDNNAFEHDYILRCLGSFIDDLKTDKTLPEILDKKAVQLTAFMMGEIAVQLKLRSQQKLIAPSATIEDVLKQLIAESGVDEVQGVLNILAR